MRYLCLGLNYIYHVFVLLIRWIRERLSVYWYISVVYKVKGICLTSRFLCNIHQTLPFPRARIARNSAKTVEPTLNLCTRYPLLLGGQRQCGFKACPRLSHLTGASGIEPQTPRFRVHVLTARPHAPLYTLIDSSSCFLSLIPVPSPSLFPLHNISFIDQVQFSS